MSRRRTLDERKRSCGGSEKRREAVIEIAAGPASGRTI
jgi:hypothetical protein